jgi:transcriptional regulator with XRE-family HTH domain
MSRATAKDVKNLRARMGITQREAATMVGITLNAWQHYEYGRRQIPEPTWRLFKLLAKDAVVAT